MVLASVFAYRLVVYLRPTFTLQCKEKIMHINIITQEPILSLFFFTCILNFVQICCKGLPAYTNCYYNKALSNNIIYYNQCSLNWPNLTQFILSLIDFEVIPQLTDINLMICKSRLMFCKLAPIHPHRSQYIYLLHICCIGSLSQSVSVCVPAQMTLSYLNMCICD